MREVDDLGDRVVGSPAGPVAVYPCGIAQQHRNTPLSLARPMG